MNTSTKLILTFFFLYALVSNNYCYSQAPEGINYQAVMRKSNGMVLVNQQMSFEIHLMQGDVNGPLSYSENFISSTNGQGVVNFIIGSGTVIQGDFALIDWGNGPYFLKLFVDYDASGPLHGRRRPAGPRRDGCLRCPCAHRAS